MAATHYLLGLEPLQEVHIFMDAAAKRYTGPGHRLFRHTLDTAILFEQYYKKFDLHLSRQARWEVALHIAYDKGVINGKDVSLMREYTKARRPLRKVRKIS